MPFINRVRERLTLVYHYFRLGRDRLGERLTSYQRSAFLGASLVSIDVFDTALRRAIARPDDVFACMAWRYLRERAVPANEIDTRIKSIVEARIAAERRSRSEAARRGSEEVTLDDIYAAFDTNETPSDRSALQEAELACERRLAVGNTAILQLYQMLVTAGIPVVFTSDTYFDDGFISALLRSAGYTGNHTVLTSSRFGRTKHAGTLFAEVCKLPRRGAGPVYHIGDNLRSDVLQARSAGVHGIWYRPKLRTGTAERVATSEATLAAAVTAGLRATHAFDADDTARAIWQQIGSDVAFPLLLGFAQWLATLVAESRPSSLLFCARDGLILKRVYDELAQRRPELPRSSYLEVSRRTLAFPSIDRIDTIELRFLSRSMMPIPVAKYLTRIGLSASDHAAQIDAAQLRPQECVTSKDPRLATLFTSISAAIIERARTERAFLLRYLDQLGCLNAKNVALCDVGWHGSMQRALERLFEKEGVTSTVTGYYLGAFPDDLSHHDRGPMNGWLADKQRTQRVPTLYRCVELIEFITTANHGSVSRYEEREATITAVYEAQDDDGLARGAAAGIIQEAALALTRKYIDVFDPYEPARISDSQAFAAIESLAERPTLSQARAIATLKHIDSYAAIQSKPIVEGLPWSRIIRDPAAVLREYKRALWPRGYSVLLFGNTPLGIAAERLYLYGRARRHRDK